MDNTRLDQCAACGVKLLIGASRCNACRSWLCDPCVDQHDCDNTMTNNNDTQSFVPPPTPNTVEELARFVVDAVREGSNTASLMRALYNNRFKNNIRYPVMERAIQFARKKDWIRFSHNKWRLHKPPGATEGIRVTLTLELAVRDLENYDATTIEEAGAFLQKQLDESHVSLIEVLDFAERVVEAKAEGRHDLLPFDDAPTPSGNNREQPGTTGTNGTQPDATEPNTIERAVTEPSESSSHLRLVPGATGNGGSDADTH